MKRKVHYFKDCTGLQYSYRNDAAYTAALNSITCGQCKGRILERVRAADWSKIHPGVLFILKAYIERNK
jgi:hypothetical protein